MRDTTKRKIKRKIRNSRVLMLAMGAVITGLGVSACGERPADNAAIENEGAPIVTEGSAAADPWERYAAWTGTQWDEYSTLADLASPPVGDIRKLDGPIQGDPEKGKELSFDRSRGGSCVACHIMGPDTPDLPGNVGPDLSTVGIGRPDEYLYNYVYDPRVYNPNTVMPPWGAHEVFSEEEVHQIVAFLKTLTEPVQFDDPAQDPARRPLPVETRDNLDPIENPAMWLVEDAEQLYNTAGPKGQSCAACHAAPEQEFATWAAQMPRYEPRMDKVLGVEEFVTRHALATTGAEWLMQSDENTAMAIYLRHLANEQPIQVDIESPGAKEAAERGQALMHRKLGQLNFNCMDCHRFGAERWVRGQYLTESRGQTPHFPTWRTSRSEVWDIRKRFQWCNVAIRANELPPDAPEYGDIELYLNSLNEGLPLSVPGIRH